MPRLKPCASLKHVWRPTKDPGVEKCEICKDVFPCRLNSCGHVDCHEARGDSLPNGMVFDPETNTYRTPVDE